jgi:hypothetical protein
MGSDQIRIISEGNVLPISDYSFQRWWNPFNVINSREPESIDNIFSNFYGA